MVSWQSVDDFRVMEYEAENAMVGKSSGFNEFKAYCSNRSPLLRFVAEAGEGIKRIDHLVEGRTLMNDTIHFSIGDISRESRGAGRIKCFLSSWLE
jgi:hypothetical protein